MKLVSVIIPAYNVENYIERCLQSILVQTYRYIEIIIIDDGSSDSTYEKCLMIADTDERIQLYKQNNQGVSAARNQGMEIAKGDYLCFIDADDFVSPLYVETMLNNLVNANADLSIVMCTRGDKIISNTDSYEIEIWDNRETLINLMRRDIYANGVSIKLFTREIIKGIYFERDIKIGEDKLFVYKVIDKCEKIVFQNISLYCYFIRNGSAMHSKFDSRYLDVKKVNENLYKMWTKRYPDLAPLFTKEVIMSYVRCVQDSFSDNSATALRLRQIFVADIKKCKFSEIRGYCTKKEKCLVFVVKNCLWIFKIYERLKRNKKVIR